MLTARQTPQWLPARDAASFHPYTYTPVTLPPDATIAAIRLTTAPSGNGEMFPIELSVAENILTVVPYSGVPGRPYTYRFEIETEAGFVYVETVQQGTLSGLSGFPIPPAADPGYGAPLMWPCPTNNFGPAKNLPPYTVAATGTTQLTAAVVPILAIVLINAGSGLGVMIGVPAAQWAGYEPVFSNRTGGVVTLYPYSGDQFESLGSNTGTTIQNDQSVTLSVAQSGAIIVR